MLPKKARLTRSELALVRRSGARLALPSLSLYVLSSVKATKVGLITPKVTTKTSVGRHTLRRRLYEAIRPLLVRLRAPIHIVLVPRGGTREEQSVFTLRSELKHALTRHLSR